MIDQDITKEPGKLKVISLVQNSCNWHMNIDINLN